MARLRIPRASRRFAAIGLLASVACSGGDSGTGGGSTGGSAGTGSGTSETRGTTAGTDGSTSSATTAASGSSGTGAPSYSHAADIQPIWDQYCVEGCHDSACATPGTCDPLKQNLDMVLDGDGYDDIVDVMSVQNPSMVRVKPGDPEASYLWHKVAGTQDTVCNGSCGNQMPNGAMPLDDATMQKIYDWIAGGAAP